MITWSRAGAGVLLSGRGLVWRVPSPGFHPCHSKLVKKKKKMAAFPQLHVMHLSTHRILFLIF